MTDNDSTIPVIGTYRGVNLHDCQSEVRLIVVRKAIDDVYGIDDFRKLIGVAGDPCWPPEARLFAAAKVEAVHAIAADRREVRPNIDLDYLRACVAGINSVTWRDPDYFCSLLDYSRWGAPGALRPAKRDVPLERGSGATVNSSLKGLNQ
jgi:hypothetical protein